MSSSPASSYRSGGDSSSSSVSGSEMTPSPAAASEDIALLSPALLSKKQQQMQQEEEDKNEEGGHWWENLASPWEDANRKPFWSGTEWDAKGTSSSSSSSSCVAETTENEEATEPTSPPTPTKSDTINTTNDAISDESNDATTTNDNPTDSAGSPVRFLRVDAAGTLLDQGEAVTVAPDSPSWSVITSSSNGDSNMNGFDDIMDAKAKLIKSVDAIRRSLLVKGKHEYAIVAMLLMLTVGGCWRSTANVATSKDRSAPTATPEEAASKELMGAKIVKNRRMHPKEHPVSPDIGRTKTQRQALPSPSPTKVASQDSFGLIARSKPSIANHSTAIADSTNYTAPIGWRHKAAVVVEEALPTTWAGW